MRIIINMCFILLLNYTFNFYNCILKDIKQFHRSCYSKKHSCYRCMLHTLIIQGLDSERTLLLPQAHTAWPSPLAARPGKGPYASHGEPRGRFQGRGALQCLEVGKGRTTKPTPGRAGRSHPLRRGGVPVLEPGHGENRQRH